MHLSKRGYWKRRRNISGRINASKPGRWARPACIDRPQSKHIYNYRMKLKFTKMHGAGNDFIVIDAIHQQIDFTPAQWQALADRRFGVGADQMLVVEKPQAAGIDF